MNRTRDRSKLALEVYAEICRKGGQTPKEIAVALGTVPRIVNEALLALEGDGILLYEDDNGGLFKFENESK